MGVTTIHCVSFSYEQLVYVAACLQVKHLCVRMHTHECVCEQLVYVAACLQVKHLCVCAYA